MASTSVLLVPVLEADPKLSPFREKLDPTQRQGMPAHVTVVVPFIPPAMMNDSTLTTLSVLFGQFSCFDFTLSRVAWFDKRVIYLAPDPSAPFRRIVEAVVRDFPDYPPYEGVFDDIIPHVTVGESGRWRKRSRAMRRAASEVERLLPIHSRASEIWLMVHHAETGRWDRVETFLLADAPSP